MSEWQHGGQWFDPPYDPTGSIPSNLNSPCLLFESNSSDVSKLVISIEYDKGRFSGVLRSKDNDCSRTKFLKKLLKTYWSIYTKFSFDCFHFSSDFCALDFFLLRDLNFSLIYKCQKLNSIAGSSLLKVK